MKLNYTEEKIFREIIYYKGNHDGNPPTLQHLVDTCGTVKSNVSHALNNLRRKGYLKDTRDIQVIGGKWIYEWPQQHGDFLPF
jgi:hypothetical protein